MAGAEPEQVIDSEKRLLRKRFRAARSGLSRQAARTAGLSILRHLESDGRWRSATRVGLFAAAEDEPDMRPLFDAVVSGGRQVFLPRCAEGHRLEFAPVRSWDDLRPGRYGLAEPTSPACVERWDLGDLVLVPGLAFDLEGGRLGRGSGYFDRAFHGGAIGQPWLVGVALELQIAHHVPMDRFDRRMDAVVTEVGIRWFGAGA